MVAAGVYVIALLYPVFAAAPGVLILMAVLAAITMLGAALAAFAQTDIKRILAYSTVSQLAYMLGALACGGRTAAIFHLLSHGAFKALLFLAAGVVIHRVGSNELSAMGGLRYRMPVTFWTTTIGLGALAGVPLTSGFFSKEGVLGAAYNAQGEYAAPGRIVLVVGLITVGLTAAYATRMWLKMFFGPFPEASPHDNRVEAPQGELVPLIVLAVPAALFGWVAVGGGAFGSWIGGAFGESVPSATAESLLPSGITTLIGLALLVLGGGVVWARWRRDPAADPAELLGPLRAHALAGFHIDALQDRLIVRPVLALARMVGFLDTEVVDAYVRGSGVGARSLGGLLRRAQTGNIQLYLTALFSGVIIIAVVFAGQVR
jgi:NADH-quinone oxidoreductase subunit L